MSLVPRPRILLWVSLAVVVTGWAPASAQPINEGFDDVAGLTGQGWTFVNNSVQPNPLGAWRRGSIFSSGSQDPAFDPQSGPAGSYVRSDFNATGLVAPTGANISDWMILPTRTLNNGDVLQFYTRTRFNSFPERLEVRLSTSGASADVGTTDSSVGVFTTLLLSINPNLQTGPANYPITWTPFTITLSGLAGPTSGRFAFRHFIPDASGQGSNGEQIGIDTLTYTPVPVPEPSTLVLVAMAGVPAAVGVWRRRSGRC